MATNRLPSHQRMFFSLAGLGAAVISFASFAASSMHAGQALKQVDPLILAAALIASGLAYYRFEQLLSTRTIHFMLWRALLTWSQVAMVTLLVFVLFGTSQAPMRETIQTWALYTPLVLLPALVAMRLSAQYLYGSNHYLRRAIFIMPGYQGRTLAMRLRRSPSLGIQTLGYFGDANPEEDGKPQGLKYLGSLDDVQPYLNTHTSNVAFISMTLMKTPYAQSILDQLGNSTHAIYLIPESPILEDFQVNFSSMAGVPLLGLHDTQILGVARSIKKCMDLTIGSLMLAMLSIPMVLIALAIRYGSPGPVVFRQIRYGLDGKPIQVMKFRSMYVHQPATGTIEQATRDDPRITPLGRFLRRTSLDELPQLFNVLNGTMSLVGPRPHAAEHNEFYRLQIKGYMLRHIVKPGITGWAQVNGMRGETDTLDKMMRRVEYDRYYIQNWSPWLDIRILFKTLMLVIRDDKAF